VTITLALFGVGGAVLKSPSSFPPLPFFGAGIVFMIGAIFFVIALKSQKYGAIGSVPAMWLRRGTIDGGDNAIPAMHAYLVGR